MKVVHLSSGHSGGAGIAARNLNRGLNENNFSSFFYALSNKNYSPSINESFVKRSLLNELAGKTNTIIESHFSKSYFYSLWSVNSIRNFSFENISSGNFVFHLHNMYNLFDYKFILNLLKKNYTVFITLHDSRYFTGGCHHTFDCVQYLNNSCLVCPEIPSVLRKIANNNVELMQEMILKHENIHFIAPSKWIADRAKNSYALNSANISLIPNAIYPTPYVPITRFSQNDGIIKIGVASVDWTAPLKGGKIIANLLKENFADFKFIFLSDFYKNGDDPEIFWRTVDFLFVPSLIDNSPNVILEAKFRGLPTLASNVGGIPEIVLQDFDKEFQINSLSASEFESCVYDMYSNFSLSKAENAYTFAVNRYQTSINAHIDLYNQMLPNKTRF